MLLLVPIKQEASPRSHNSPMAAYSSKEVMTLKLLVDKRKNKVLFAEAGKDFVDFLFTLLSLPVATVVRLLADKSMVGSLGNLYESIENLSESYMQPNQSKEVFLKPKAAVGLTEAYLILTNDNALARPPVSKMYKCGNCHRHVTDDPKVTCPSCKYFMTSEVTFVPPKVADGEGGYVKGVVTYMVTDDLAVMPMSTISGIALLSKWNVTNVASLEEKVVTFGMDEGLKLLKATLHSNMVLTSVFLEGMGTTDALRPCHRRRNRAYRGCLGEQGPRPTLEMAEPGVSFRRGTFSQAAIPNI